MKKILLTIILFTVIFSYVYSYEEKEVHDFFYNIINELQYARELCIMYNNGAYNGEELKIIEGHIKNQLSGILQNIKNNKILVENDLCLKRILVIINYEVNNLYNIKFVNGSDEIIRKVDILIDITFFALIVINYDKIIPDQNL